MPRLSAPLGLAVLPCLAMDRGGGGGDLRVSDLRVSARDDVDGLPESTRETDTDEIEGLIWALLREGESPRGIRIIVQRAWRTGRVRDDVPGTRLATIGDYRRDLEECVVHLRSLGTTRRTLNPLLRRALPVARRSTEPCSRAAC